MAEKHLITKMDMTCGACPSQWEGTTADRQYVYMRYRHGWFSCTIGNQEALSVEWQRQDGGDSDGVMNWQEMQEITADLFDWSRFGGAA